MKHLDVIILIVILTSFPVGCDRDTTSSKTLTANSKPQSLVTADLKLVQDVLAKQLGLKPEAIGADRTLAALKADDLDLVEAVMEIEDRLKISISDEAINKMAGTTQVDQVVARLTVRQLASVVTASRAQR